MILRIALLTSVLIGIATSASLAGVRIPLGAAMAQCAQSASAYGQTLFGQGGDTVDSDRQQSYYRSCVRAKSGQYPPKQAGKTGLRISGSASIGFVLK